LYNNILRKIKLKWIGLRLNPPLLLHPTPIRELYDEKEKHDCKEIKKNAEYHCRGAITEFVAYDLKQTRKKQE
jgi:hypothetical protein